jgi:hypothetical protein
MSNMDDLQDQLDQLEQRLEDAEEVCSRAEQQAQRTERTFTSLNSEFRFRSNTAEHRLKDIQHANAKTAMEIANLDLVDAQSKCRGIYALIVCIRAELGACANGYSHSHLNARTRTAQKAAEVKLDGEQRTMHRQERHRLQQEELQKQKDQAQRQAAAEKARRREQEEAEELEAMLRKAFEEEDALRKLREEQARRDEAAHQKHREEEARKTEAYRKKQREAEAARQKAREEAQARQKEWDRRRDEWRRQNTRPPPTQKRPQPSQQKLRTTADDVKRWRDVADAFFKTPGLPFPEPPAQPCGQIACQSQSRALKACGCNITKALRSVAMDLKKERLRWHPDKFATEHQKKAQEIFVVVQAMFEKSQL